jgi:osmotically inducible protein OsmC
MKGANMPLRTASAVWNGKLKDGNGTMKLGSGAYEGQYSFASRFEEGTGTNPEELIGAAHAGCFSMAFSAALEKEGFEPKSISTEAKVNLVKGDEGFSITEITLDCKAEIPNIDEAKFQEIAEGAKKGCPVSRALAGVDIKLNAALV